MNKIRKLRYTLVFCIITIVLSTMLFSPFMFCNDTFITRQEVKELGSGLGTVTLSDARNCGFNYDDIFLFDFRLKKDVPTIYELTKDGLKKSNFRKIAPGIWRCKNADRDITRIFAYESESKKYYFVYKSL